MTEFASFKRHFSRALAAGAPRLHLAAHSHHLWPDVTQAAHMQAWQDAASQWDDKWSHVFGTLIPAAQAGLARHLMIGDPACIAFAPNTHEFLVRLFSCLPTHRVPRILTTDSEFNSFARQAARLEEDGLIALMRIATQPFDTFMERFAAAAAQDWDMVFSSQVFFNSGFAVPSLDLLVRAVENPACLVVIDGYHGFLARQTDLSAIADRAFYLGGGYKYAMAGEGACFLVCPPGYAPRPCNTGWYAAFRSLTNKNDKVAYAADGGRFMGATFDPSGLYRLAASLAWLAEQGLTGEAIHARAEAMQSAFLERVTAPGLAKADLIVPAGCVDRGNFLAFRSNHAVAWQERLSAAGIVTDLRGDILRIGFGLYHDLADMPEIASRILRA